MRLQWYAADIRPKTTVLVNIYIDIYEKIDNFFNQMDKGTTTARVNK